jgi:hypothetical protein
VRLPPEYTDQVRLPPSTDQPSGFLRRAQTKCGFRRVHSLRSFSFARAWSYLQVSCKCGFRRAGTKCGCRRARTRCGFRRARPSAASAEHRQSAASARHVLSAGSAGQGLSAAAAEHKCTRCADVRTSTHRTLDIFSSAHRKVILSQGIPCLLAL